MDDTANTDHAFIVGLVCFGVGAVVLIIAVILLVCYCKYNKKFDKQKAAADKARERQRHLHDYFRKTSEPGDAPGDTTLGSSASSWGRQSTHASDKSLTRYENGTTTTPGHNNNNDEPKSEKDVSLQLNVADLQL